MLYIGPLFHRIQPVPQRVGVSAMKIILLAFSIAAAFSAVVSKPRPHQRSVEVAQSDVCSALGSDPSSYVRDYDVENSKLAVRCKIYMQL